MKEYDCIVVGAGPAGTSTARFAAQGGARTLVLERKKVIGEPVQCGEFIPSLARLQTILPHARKLEELFDYDNKVLEGKVEGITMVAPSGREYPIKFDGVTVSRARFDQWLAVRAKEAGAEIMTGTVVTGFKDGCLETNRGKFKGKVYVGADGPRSTVAKAFGLERPTGLYPCAACLTDDKLPPIVKMYFGSVAPGGYAWIIPKEKGGNLGLGLWPGMSSVSLRDAFQSFIKGVGITPKKLLGGVVPMSGPLARTVKGNALLVGDAAGHVMASNGGGIPIAMLCGRAAGKTITRHLESGTSLEKYETEWRGALGDALRTSAKTKAMGDKVFRNDFLLETAMRILGSRGLERAILCKPVFGFS